MSTDEGWAGGLTGDGLPADEGLPIEVDPMLFRQVLGTFATGVAVVTAALGGHPQGMAVNSFTAVSLDPPLVGFCAARTSSTWPLIRASAGFAVNILTHEQEQVCRTFAGRGADRFAGLEWTAAPSGEPLLTGALAHIVCRRYAVHEAGDHEFVLGRVVDLQQDDAGQPLLFFRGRYARLVT